MAEAAMHDDGLSPTSKKILKECTVELPAAAVKDNRVSFVARPPSSGGQDAGFYFARPTLPRRAFTSHPQARSSRATSEEDKGLSQSQGDDERALPPDASSQDKTVIVVDTNSVDRPKTKSPERARTVSPSLERVTPTKPTSKIMQPTRDIPQPILSNNIERAVPINTQQATEDELFNLLIQKLKKREEAAVAASKLIDELKASLCTADENNKQLTIRINELDRQCKEEQKEKVAQRQSVDRWKLKFAIEEAKALARKIEAEKSVLELNSKEVEKRIREELSRASLMSKDQERAKFEQERHTLTREKQQAESEAAKGKEELEAVKLSLADSISKHEELQATVASYQQRVTDIEHKCEIVSMAHEQALSALKQYQTSQVGEKESAQQQLQAIQNENIILKQEISALKLTSMAISGENATLKQENATLQQTNIVNHEENVALQQKVADTKSQLDALEKENANVQAEKEEREKEITDLRAVKVTNEAERAIMQAENTVLRQENAEVKADNAALKAENAVLTEQKGRSTSDKPARALSSALSITTPNDPKNSHIKKEKDDISTSSEGILNGIQPMAAVPAQRKTQFHTPSGGNKKKSSTIEPTAPRRQSRISSRFFDPQPTPSPSLSVITSQQDSTTWTVNQSVDTFMSQSKVHRRKRRRGEEEDMNLIALILKY
ncbi:hypothetical protein H109_03803 [Trichophyton interdigitale MR816]|uniref:Uncharacterized protein n=1 Tax=Trichophyton interdigitale (strain MR816) TaxID=1215338 RepID=A0A059JA43_TRIIM|nr:hypothetical protein H109_03803 [Trichophyton interdigitale MR816]